MTGSKVPLTGEMLALLDEYCGQREDADKETCLISVYELRALIDAARRDMAERERVNRIMKASK